MPGVVPQAQGGQRRPGAVGGAVAPASTVPPSGTYVAGQEIEVAVEDVGQGGWCIAKPEGRPVLFVRHALPGERVVARVTEVTAHFARADAVRIVSASPDRVEPPCPNAGPGRCGGCDWQHASLPAQRELKAAVIAQQLRRLAGLDLPVTVEPLPGDGPGEAGAAGAGGRAADSGPGLGWRTRMQFAVAPDGTAGLRRHRSHQVVDIGDCPLAVPALRELDIPGEDWAGASAVEAAVGGAESRENFAVTVVEETGGRPGGKNAKGAGRRGGGRKVARTRRTLAGGRPYLAEQAAGRLWQVGADGFWQVHPAAADTLSQAVLEALNPQPGDTVLDLYCGAGLFAGVAAPLVGPDGAVAGVESDPAAVKNARQNLAEFPWASFQVADAARAAAEETLPPARLVIADPPRAGLAREVISYLAGDGPAERFAYVSCDPATLARDLALLADGGWRLERLRAFDAFPMTHHVECVATLTRDR